MLELNVRHFLIRELRISYTKKMSSKYKWNRNISACLLNTNYNFPLGSYHELLTTEMSWLQQSAIDK